MYKKKESTKITTAGNNSLFCIALVCILIFGIVGIVSADTSVKWTLDIGDVTSVDMALDGSIIYAAVQESASSSTIYVYDNGGVEQNTFNVNGVVQKIVCTDDGSMAAAYVSNNEVYFINNGLITWTQTFTDICDIDISNHGSVLIVESNKFHKYMPNGTVEYDSTSGIFDLGVIDPNDEYAIIDNGGSDLKKYILTTTNDYWARIGNTSFNPAFQDYQNLVILHINQTNAIILTEEMLGEELWTAINQDIAISNQTLSQNNNYKYYKTPSGATIDWLSATSSVGWTARSGACSWVFDNKLWIGAGNYMNDVWWSSDGVQWTQATSSAPWSGRTYACSWVFDNKMWIGGGLTSGSTVSAYLQDMWWSSDGVQWTQATSSAGYGRRYGACSWVFDNKMWIGGGRSSSSIFNDVWWSSDGSSWTRATSAAPWDRRVSASTWVYDDKLWIGGGVRPTSTTVYFSDVWWSSDGVQWTQATSSAAWTARSDACSWVFDNKLWIGGGRSSSSIFNDVWWSSDGSSWTRATSSAAWTARSDACSWVFDNKLWIGGGSGLADIWYSTNPYVQIPASGDSEKYIFYNYTGDNPQYTPTISANTDYFNGTYSLHTKPTLSIYTLQTTKTLNGNIISISVSDRGDWIGTATSTYIYHDQITNTGFGTEYNYILGSEGTVYDIATANGASMSVIGQGLITDIYSQTTSRVGTYTAGGAVTHVDIADRNALWATSGGEDGKVYIFSKDASSNWYLEYSSDSEDPVTALRISSRGEYILAGRTSSLTLYQTTTPEITTTEFWFTLYAYKDSDSYRNAAVNVSVYSGNQWNFLTQGLTDSVGKYVILLTAGQNYKFDVGNGEKIMIYQATPNVNSQTISIYSSPISSSVTYGATWDTQAGGIQFKYADSSGQTQNLNVKIMRTDTWETVYDETFTGTESINETLPIIDDTTSYKVEFSANRVSGVTRNNFFVSASQDIIPIPLDKNILNVLFSCLLILIAGLFSYMSAIRGAVVVAMCAIFFTYLGWLTIPWHWLIIAIVIAMVAGFTQRRS